MYYAQKHGYMRELGQYPEIGLTWLIMMTFYEIHDATLEKIIQVTPLWQMCITNKTK